MKKIIIFGSKHWPGCKPVKEFLSQNNVEFVYSPDSFKLGIFLTLSTLVFVAVLLLKKKDGKYDSVFSDTFLD